MEEKLNQELLARNEWYLNQMKQYKLQQIENKKENMNEDESDDIKEEFEKIDSFMNDEFDDKSLKYEHLTIEEE